MVKCSFCGGNVLPGCGFMFVKKDGKVLNFCKSKCKKNMLHLDRKPIRLKWTQRYKKAV